MNLTVHREICQIMCDADWEYDKLNALMQLGFCYADVVLMSGIVDPTRYALRCVSLPLHYYMQAFLLPFGWTEDGGILISPESSVLNRGDIIALIENSRKAFQA